MAGQDCSRTLGPTDTNIFGTSMVTSFRLPAGYDVYHVFSNFMSVRQGYEGLLTNSKDLALKKCGASSDYNLIEIKYIPWRCCYPSLPPAISANIQCVALGQSQTPAFLKPLENNEAKKECEGEPTMLGPATYLKRW